MAAFFAFFHSHTAINLHYGDDNLICCRRLRRSLETERTTAYHAGMQRRHFLHAIAMVRGVWEGKFSPTSAEKNVGGNGHSGYRKQWLERLSEIGIEEKDWRMFDTETGAIQTGGQRTDCTSGTYRQTVRCNGVGLQLV